MGKVFRLKSISLGVILGLYGGGAALANPTGAQVVHGTASFHAPNTSTLQITNSPNAIINWQDFSIANGEITQFIQQNAQSAVLNRVVGNNLSEIHGTLASNGRVFLINQAGIVFGENALVDTAGLVASTLDISNHDFLSGNFHFEGEGAGSIINKGVIAAGPGGEIVLIAPQIENSGAITVEDGALILAAGESVTLSSWDLDGVEFEVQAPENEVLNLGELVAEKGAIGLFAGSIRNEGRIEANSLSVDASGNIVLSAVSDVTVTNGAIVDASGAAGGDVLIQSQSGDTVIEGKVLAVGEQADGGDIQILGDRVGLFGNAQVDASGQTGGGQVLIGGNYQGQGNVQTAKQTIVSDNASVSADSLETGDAGKVIVWADEHTEVHGSLSASAKGNSGDGGFIEASGKESLIMRGQVDATANNGETGTILFDPKNITIGGAGLGSITGNSGFSDNPTADVTFTAAAIQSALTAGNVVLQANNDITFAETFTHSGPANSLDVSAGRSVTVNAGVMITLTGGNFNILANAPSTGATPVVASERDAGAADIRMLTGSAINTGGGSLSMVIGDGAGRTGAFATVGNVALNDATVATTAPGSAGNVLVSGGAVQLFGTSSIASVPSSGGAAGTLIVEANDIEISGSSFLDSGNGADSPSTITIRTRSDNPSQNISLGYATAQAGTLSLDASELATGIRTNGQGLIIGDASHTGNINIGGTIAAANYNGLTLNTQGTVNFLQSGVAGINLGGQNVSITANRVLGSSASTAQDIGASNLVLNTVNGIQQNGGGALQVLVDNLSFTNTTGGEVNILSVGSATTVANSANNNADIILSHNNASQLRLNNVQIASGTGNLVANTSQAGSGIEVQSGGVANNGTGDIELNAAGTGNIVNQISGTITTTNGNIALKGTSFVLSGSGINAGTGQVRLAPSTMGDSLTFGTGGISASALMGITASDVIIGSDFTGTRAGSIIWNMGGDLLSGVNSNYFLETTDGGDINIQSSLNVGANNLTFTTDQFVLGYDNGATLSGTGDLVFNARTQAVQINSSGAGLELSANEVGALNNGFNEIAFSTQANQDINVGGSGAVSFNDRLILNANGNVNIQNQLTQTSNAETRFSATNGTVNINNNIRTAGGVVTVNNNALVGNGVSVDTTNGGTIGTGANIVFNGTIDGSATGNAFSTQAGTAGSVTYGGNVGTTTALSTLGTIAGGGVNVAGNVTTDNTLSFNSNVTLTGGTSNFQSNTGSVNFTGTLDAGTAGVQSAAITAGGSGAISLGNVGQSRRLGFLTTAATNINAANVSTVNTQSYNGNLTLTGGLSTTNSQISVASNLTLGGIAGTRTMSTDSGAGNIIIGGNVNGSAAGFGFNASAGTGNVTLGSNASMQNVGTTNALASLGLNGANVSLDNVGTAPSTAGVTGPINITATNNINFNGTHIVGSGAQTYNAGGGYLVADDLQIIATGAQNITLSGGNVQMNTAGKQFELISNGGNLNTSTANIFNDGTTNNATAILNSGGGSIQVGNVGQAGAGTTQLNSLFVNAATGTATLNGNINSGDIANSRVAIQASNVVVAAGSSIVTDKTTNDGNIYFITDDITIDNTATINTGSSDVLFDTRTSTNIVLGGSTGGLAISDAELDRVSSTGKIIFGLDAATASALGGLTARSGAVNFAGGLTQTGKNIVINTTGAVSSNAGAGLDLEANSLEVFGAVSTGTNSERLETTLNTLGGTYGTGLYIQETDAITLQNLGQSISGVIDIQAAGDIDVHQITGNGGVVTLTSTAGRVLDAGTPANNPNITNVFNANLNGFAGVGQSANSFEVEGLTGTLTVGVSDTSGDHDLYVDNVGTAAGNLNVGGISNASGGTSQVRNLNANQTTTLTGGSTTQNNGNLIIESQGNLTQNAAINAGGTGAVTLRTTGAGNIQLNNNILGNSGNVLVQATNGNVELASNTGQAINTTATIDLQSSNGHVNMTGTDHRLTGGAAQISAATGISLANANNAVTSLQAQNTTSGSINFTNGGALTVSGSGVANNSANVADGINLTSNGIMQVNASVTAAAGNINLVSNNNAINIQSSAGSTVDVRTVNAADTIINAGTANVLVQGGAVANSDVNVQGGGSAGGQLQVIASNLTVAAGNANASSAKLSAYNTDIDLAGGLIVTGGTGASGSEASIDGSNLLDIDLSGAGNVAVTGGGAGASASHAILGSNNQIDINTGGSVVLTGGAGNNSFAAIGSDSTAVTVNIGQGTAIGGSVQMVGGTGTGSVAAVGVQSSSASVSDATVNIRTDNDFVATANTGGVNVGAFQQGGSNRSTAGSVSIEAGLGSSGGEVTLENSIVQTGTAGSVYLNARDINPGGLITVGRVTQGVSGGILADQLYVKTQNDDTGNQTQINLTGSGNDVNKVALRLRNVLDSATINANAVYTDVNDVQIHGAGILTTGEFALEGGASSLMRVTSTSGQVTQAATAEDAIVAGFLDVSSATGTTLNNIENDISFFSASNSTSGNIELFEKDGFTVGASALIDGISNVGRNVQLVSTGAINQQTGGDDQIVAGALHAETRNAGGSLINLSHTANDVDSLILRAMDVAGTSRASGALTFVDTDGFQVLGTGLTTGQNAVETNSAINLTAGGNITQGAAATDAVVTFSGLNVKTLNNAGAGIALNNAANNINGVVSLEARNAADSANAAGAIDLNTTAAILLGDTRTSGNAQIAMTGGSLNQNSAAALEVGGVLTVSSDSGISLTESTNAINAINATNGASGNLHVTNSGSWTVDATNGATTGATNVITSNSGNVTVNVINTGSLGSQIVASNGAIIDGNGAANNFVGTGITLQAANGIGSGDSLESASTGGINATNSSTGDIDITQNHTGSAITVALDNNATSGNINLTSQGANGDLAVFAANAIDAANGNVVITTTAADADVTMSASGDINAVNGNITVNAGGGISVNRMNSGTGLVSLASANGAITDVNGATSNIVAASTTLSASGGIDIDFAHSGLLTVNSITAGGNAAVSNMGLGGSLAINGNANVGANQLTLSSAGTLTQSSGTITAADLIVTAAGATTLNNTVINTADITASGAITLTDTGTLQINRLTSTGGALSNISATTTGAMTVANNGINNANGDVSLTAQGINVTANIATNNNLVLNAQSGALTVQDAMVTSSAGTADIDAASLAITATGSQTEIQANGNVDVDTTGTIVLTGGSTTGAHAILESTTGSITVDAGTAGSPSTIALTAGAGDQDALIKAASGSVTLQHANGGCTNCLQIGTLTGAAQAGIFSPSFNSLLFNFFNWSGSAGNGLWSDTSNWFGGAAPTSGTDVNLATGTGSTVTVDSVIGINSLAGDKALAINGSGGLTIASNFTYNDAINLNGGDLILSGAANSLEDVTVNNAASDLTTAGTLDINNSLQLNAGRISGAGSLDVSPQINWNGGTIALTTNAQNGVTFGGAGTKTLSATLTGDDNSSMSGGGSLDIVGSGRFIQSAGNFFDIQDGTVLSSDATGTFENNGEIRKTGAGTANFTVGLDNRSGSTVNVNTGTLNIAGTPAATDLADYNINGTSSLRVTANRNLAGAINSVAGSYLRIGPSANLTLSGTGSSHSGEVDMENNSTLTLSSVNIFNGAVSDSSNGSIVINAGSTFNQGMDLSGTLQVGAGSNVIVNANSNINAADLTAIGATISGSASQININNLSSQVTSSILATGSVRLNGTSTIDGSLNTGATTNIENNGTLNLNNATINVLSTQGTLTNNSTMNVAGAGQFRTNVVNTGTVNVNASGVVGAQGTVSNTGNLNINSGTLDITGSLTQSAPGVTTLNGGTLQAASPLTIGGGSLNWVSGNLNADTTVSGALNVTGTAVASNVLVMDGTANIGATGNLTLTQNASHTAPVVIDGQMVTNGNQSFDGAVSGGGLLNVQSGMLVVNGNATGINVTTASGTNATFGATSDFRSVTVEGTLGTTNDLNVTNALTLLGGANIVGGGVVNTNDLLINGNSTVAKDLNVSGSAVWASGDINLTGNGLVLAPTADMAVSASGATLTGALVNQGGQVVISAPASVTADAVINAGLFNITGSLTSNSNYDQFGGATLLNGGTLTAMTMLNGGGISGAGTIVGDTYVTNAVIDPGLTPSSIGTININGNLNLGAGSILGIELAGPGNSDQLVVQNAVTIDPAAAMGIVLLGGYTPSAGDSFSPIQYGSVSGSFGLIPAGFNATFGPSALAVVATTSNTGAISEEEFNNITEDDIASIEEEIAELFDETEEDVQELGDTIDEIGLNDEEESSEEGEEEREDENGEQDYTEEEGDTEFSGTLICRKN